MELLFQALAGIAIGLCVFVAGSVILAWFLNRNLTDEDRRRRHLQNSRQIGKKKY